MCFLLVMLQMDWIWMQMDYSSHLGQTNVVAKIQETMITSLCVLLIIKFLVVVRTCLPGVMNTQSNI